MYYYDLPPIGLVVMTRTPIREVALILVSPLDKVARTESDPDSLVRFNHMASWSSPLKVVHQLG